MNFGGAALRSQDDARAKPVCVKAFLDQVFWARVVVPVV